MTGRRKTSVNNTIRTVCDGNVYGNLTLIVSVSVSVNVIVNADVNISVELVINDLDRSDRLMRA